MPLDTSFESAAAGLRAIAADGWLTDVSAEVYDSSVEGISGLAKVGPSDSVKWISKLVRVYIRDVVSREGKAVLTLRWEATGPGGGLFPALDADITLAQEENGSCLLTLDGAYRPPFGAIGAGLDKVAMSRVATPTAKTLLRQVAESITRSQGSSRADPDAPPGKPPAS